ncbi:MAG: hypothetical protein JXR05_15395 [Flavobacteriaceae bacterium]
MRIFICLITIGVLFISCNSDDGVNNSDSNTPLTESLVELGIKYGSEERQFLDLYKAESNCPTPIYFDAHGNGGNTSIPNSIVEDLNAQGITIIAWESLTSVNTPDEVEMGRNDAELMFQWVIDNAETYNLDTSNIIIGGSSRGSILSWIYGHRPNQNIKGLYMYNALPSTVWALPSWWLPTENVNVESPAIHFVYRREPGSSSNASDPDIHDPNNGITIVNEYQSLGIGDRATLVHSIGETNNIDKYQFLVDFILSVIETCL